MHQLNHQTQTIYSMKPTLFAGIIASLSFAIPAQAQDKPAKQEKNITINIDANEIHSSKDRKGKIKIVRNVNGKEEVIEREFIGEMPADLKEELNKMSPDAIKEIHINKDGKGNGTNTQKRVIMLDSKIQGDNADKFDFKFDIKSEMSAETKKMLEEKGVKIDGNAIHFSSEDIKKNKDGKNVFIFHSNDNNTQSITQTYKLEDGKEVKVSISKICIIKINDEATESKDEESKAESNDEPKVDDLTVYPNPSDGEFNLKFNLEQKGDAQITLFDKEGNKLYEETLKDFEGAYQKPLNLKGQKAGNYILKIIQNGKTYTRQVVLR